MDKYQTLIHYLNATEHLRTTGAKISLQPSISFYLNTKKQAKKTPLGISTSIEKLILFLIVQD